MKITKSQLKQIIQEELNEIPRATEVEVLNYLKDRAQGYHNDPILDSDGDNVSDFGTVQMLLQDDFIENFGHDHDIRYFENEIAQLARDPELNEGKGKAKITKAPLNQIIKEELKNNS